MILYEIKRKVYYSLTQTNDEVAFQSELFLRENANWIMKRPIKYALCLVGMNIKEIFKKNKYKELVPGVHSLHRVVKRPKVYQISGIISKSDVLVVDIFDALFTRVVLKNGQKLYLENPYVRKIIETAQNNEIKVIGVGSTKVSERKTKYLLEKQGIEFEELRVPKASKFSKNAVVSKKKLVKTLLQKNYEEKKETNFEYPAVVLSGDFDGMIKPAKEKYAHAIYYRPNEKLMDMVAMEKADSDFGKIHRAIVGLEAFSGEQNHTRIFECAYCIIAPILYIVMEEIQRKKEDATVVILGDEESLFANIYQSFYGDAKVIGWSSLASCTPKDEAEWQDMISDSVALRKIPANRAAYSMGFESEDCIVPVGECQEEFIKEMLSRLSGDEDARIAYVKRALDGEKKILVVDALAEEISLSNFEKIAGNLGVEVETISIKDYLWEEELEEKQGERTKAEENDKSESEENEMGEREENEEGDSEEREQRVNFLLGWKEVLSFASPYMTAIFENEIGFAYPKDMKNEKRNLIEGAIIKYFQTYRNLKREYKAIEPPTREDAKLLSHVNSSAFKNMIKGGKIV